VNRVVVQTLRLPHGFSCSQPSMVFTALVRRVDRSIVTNVRNESGDPGLVVLSDRGELRHAQVLPRSFPGPGQFIQQMDFDPTDPAQHKVVTGIPFAPRLVALDPFAKGARQRAAILKANNIGTKADHEGRIYVGNWSTGEVLRFTPDPRRLEGEWAVESFFAFVSRDTGSRAISAIATDTKGGVYIAQSLHGRIARYSQRRGHGSSTGAFVGFISDPALGNVTSLYFDPVGHLLYAGSEDTSRVVVFNTSGARVASSNSGDATSGYRRLFLSKTFPTPRAESAKSHRLKDAQRCA
jgi:hypothetical protein